MFPLKKEKILVSYNDFIHTDFTNIAEIPANKKHPGSFAYKRANHRHEGVDIYCNFGDEVYSCQSGEIVKIIPFTGEIAGSPWWNNTYCILVKHKHFYINYGEISPLDDLFVGQKIKQGFLLGYVVPVLKKNKGRPMNMLHLEMYDKDSELCQIPIKSWNLDTIKHEYLIDPTNYLLNFENSSSFLPKNN